uniref:Metallophosphatase family protein n=1 Tax=Candidatus Desulfatibia profunda TaxID=2841695 RepID=A0A8J6TNW1_9BACT|nr:metallophosphatase family protein [Candidatus Desulfatibia profunda]
MRLAVISDIHGNLEAFREVLLDIEGCRIDTVVCLGDTIGYGPEPEQALALIRQRNIPSVMGNHELAVKDPKQLTWFNPRARKSLKMTAKLLSADSIDYIMRLKPFLNDHRCRFVHGFPPDSATRYLFQASKEELIDVFNQMKEQRCFIGHTHTLEIVEFDGAHLAAGRV